MSPEEPLLRPTAFHKALEDSGPKKLSVSSSEILSAMEGTETSFREYYPDTNQTIIRGIALQERLVIDGLNSQTKLSFVSCDFCEVVEIRGGTFNGFSIDGGHITKPFIIRGGIFNDSFTLQEVDAEDMEDEVYVSVGFWGGEFNCNVSIYKGAFQRISIRGAVLKGISISTSFWSSYNHKLEPYIKNLEVSPKQIEILEINNFKIERMSLVGILQKGLYYFGDVSFNQLEFRWFVNLGRVRFDRSTTFRVMHERFIGQPWSTNAQGQKVLRGPHRETSISEPSLSMEHSDFGETRFSQMDFTRFAHMKIIDCTLTQVESSDTKWFSSEQMEKLDDGAKRDLYRQLKHAMIHQGNRIDELHFQALEMEAYRRTLSFKTDFWDKLILVIGKYTNNFGTNYTLPAIWIVAVSFLIFLVSLWALGLSFGNNWGSMFTVMNPTHSIDYLVPKDKVSNSFLAVDFSGRILISVLIYQLIVPFRKFASR